MAIAKIQYKENASATPVVWMDTTQKTVTPATMLSGVTALKNDGTSITGTYTPSGGGTVELKDVNFIDYDGTILHSYTKTEFANLSDLPSNPSHTGLTSQGWNWTKAQITAQLTAMPIQPVWVGQMYVTTSGASEIDITLDDPEHLSPYLTIAVNGTVSVDWGDNSTSSTVTGTSLTILTYTLHEYASTGDYTIKISVSSGSFAFYNTNSSKGGVLSVYGSDSNRRYDRRYSDSITAIRIGSSVTSIGNTTFSNCSSLQSVTIPSSVTSIGTYAFGGCYSLQSVTIPSGVTSIENFVFNSCFSLQSVTIPSSVTSIGTQAFNSCYGILEYHIKPTTPPTLSDTNAFSGIMAGTIIYVPSASLTAYQTASNWSTYASYMQGE